MHALTGVAHRPAPAASQRQSLHSTVGYGDYTARTNLGHTLAVSEALIGQIYLVTVIAPIVGRLVPRAGQAA